MSIVYNPVVSAQSGDYHGKALVGTHSAIIGWSFNDETLRKGLHGFAIKRLDYDRATGELLRLDWLKGYKRFKETDAGHADEVSSLQAPFQRFRWNDYTLRPDRYYQYEVHPMRGKPGNLVREEKPLIFDVCPSLEDQDDLGVYVNRGVTAAMAYLQRFKNQPPDEVGEAAYRWLSRGLKESLLNFIDSAKPGEALHVCIYEFFDHQVAAAFKAALDRGVLVEIAHDAKKNKHSTEKNFHVLEEHGLKPPVSFPRTTVNISHNKIVIKLVNGKPTEVWTGSANFSENAFNFQTNCALVLRDASALKYFEEYFQALKLNPAKAKSKDINRDIVDRADAEANRFAERNFFSPLRSNDIIECSVDMIKAAKSAVLISAPFGLHKDMVAALHGNSPKMLEYGLVNAAAKRKIETLHKNNTRFFPPKKLVTYLGRKWDAKAFGAHKIHAKTMVVDPFGDNPLVLNGSANFSKPSCQDNDENAMYITGNKRLAAIFTTEFMRMYDHYKSRYYIDLFNEKNKQIRKENKLRAQQGKPLKKLKTMDKYLKSDESWSKTSYDPTSSSHKYRDRIVFSGG